MKRIKYLFLFGAVVGGFMFCGIAGATTISPTKIEASLNPGQVGKYSMTLYNETKEDLYLDGSVELFEPKGDEGQAQTVSGSQDKILSWLKLPTPSLVLKPGEYKNVPLIIEVPKDVSVGGYYYAIMWQSGSEPIKSQSQIGISSRVGCLVLLDVGGEKNEKLQIIDFKLNKDKKFYSSLPISFVSHLQNDGNTHLKPKGSIILQNFLGQVVEVVPFNDKDFNILPKTVRKFDSVWKDKNNSWIAGPFSAKLALEYGDFKIRTESNKIYFWVIPWKWVIGFIIAIAIVIILIYILKRKKNNR